MRTRPARLSRLDARRGPRTHDPAVPRFESWRALHRPLDGLRLRSVGRTARTAKEPLADEISVLQAWSTWPWRSSSDGVIRHLDYETGKYAGDFEAGASIRLRRGVNLRVRRSPMYDVGRADPPRVRSPAASRQSRLRRGPAGTRVGQVRMTELRQVPRYLRWRRILSDRASVSRYLALRIPATGASEKLSTVYVRELGGKPVVLRPGTSDWLNDAGWRPDQARPGRFLWSRESRIARSPRARCSSDDHANLARISHRRSNTAACNLSG
jgi:hypothetical protein